MDHVFALRLNDPVHNFFPFFSDIGKRIGKVESEDVNYQIQNDQRLMRNVIG
jgi:hypothetical protein